MMLAPGLALPGDAPQAAPPAFADTLPKVAVIGGGLSGCSFARSATSAGNLRVTLFEGSRNVGGRASTRRCDGADMVWSHGSPCIRRTEELTDTLLGSLPGVIQHEFVKKHVVTVPPEDGNVPLLERSVESAFVGEAGMSDVCTALVQSAGELLTIVLDTFVTLIDLDDHGKWLLWSHDEFLGEFDWLAITTPQLFSEPWARLVGLTSTPGRVLSDVAPPPEACLKRSYISVMSALLAFEVSPSAFSSLEALDYDALDIVGDKVLSRVIFERRHFPCSRETTGVLELTLHSTMDFAMAYLERTGASSTMYRVSASQHKCWSRSGEDEVLTEMLQAFRELMQKVCQGNVEGVLLRIFSRQPIRRMLHRWRSAWPTEENRRPAWPSEAATLGFIAHPDHRLVYLGDCVDVIVPMDLSAEFVVLGADAAGRAIRDAATSL